MAKKDWRGPTERTNHRLLWLCGGIGGVVGVAMSIVSHRSGGPRHFSLSDVLESPLPAWFALAVAGVFGVIVPVLSWRWHRVVDEHERIAYKDGALAGFYVISVAGPVWWVLWRGGLVPAVNGYGVYAATMAATGIVWMWRKYA